MSTVLSEVLTANQKYSESFGEKANLALPPARRFAVLTCMDARLDPAKYAGCRKAMRMLSATRAVGRAMMPFVRCYQLQTAGHSRVLRCPSHRLRHGILYQRRDPRIAQQQPGNSGAYSRWFSRHRKRARVARRRIHRVACHSGPESSGG